MRHSRERIGQVARHEKIDLLLSDDIADGPANPSSLGRPYRVGQHQEVDVPSSFRVIGARAEEEHPRPPVVAADCAQDGIPLPVRQSHEIDRKIAVSQSQASVSGFEVQGSPKAILSARAPSRGVAFVTQLAVRGHHERSDPAPGLGGPVWRERASCLVLRAAADFNPVLEDCGAPPQRRCDPLVCGALVRCAVGGGLERGDPLPGEPHRHLRGDTAFELVLRQRRFEV